MRMAIYESERNDFLSICAPVQKLTPLGLLFPHIPISLYTPPLDFLQVELCPLKFICLSLNLRM